MTAESVMADVAEQGVIGIVRTGSAEAAEQAAVALLTAGLRAVEVSLTTPGGLDVVATLSDRHGSVGAGTVRTLAQARDARAAGAAFLVSPTLDVEVVRYAVEHDLAVVPGCLTPTEMAMAQAAGANAVKIFPAHLWTPKALAGMREAMPDLRCVPTGGVSAETAPAWITAGALAVGIGGSLTRSADPTTAVADLLGAVRTARG